MITTKQAQSIFGVSSSQTIRNWSKEFAQYLSPGAAPGRGSTRYFTYDDLKVLALIANMSSKGRSFEAIHANLLAGQRGDISDLKLEEIEQSAGGSERQNLSIQFYEASALVQRLQQELEGLRPLHDENIRIRTEFDAHKNHTKELMQEKEKRIAEIREEKDKRIAQLEQQLQEARQKIDSLTADMAYDKGYREGIDKGKKDSD